MVRKQVMIPSSRVGFLWNCFTRYKYYYLLGMFCIFLTNYGLASIPLYIKEFIDLIEKEVSSVDIALLKNFFYALSLVIFVAITRTLSRILFFNTARKVEFELKNQLFNKVTKLARNYFLENQTGKIISQINNDTLWVRLLCGFGIMQVTNVIFAFSLIPYKMWQLSASITFYIILSLLLIFSFIYKGILQSMKYYLKRMQVLQSLSSNILSTLNGLDIIRSCCVQDWSKQQFQDKNEALYQYSIKAAFCRALFSPLLNNTETVLKVLIFYMSAIIFFRGEFSIGEITAMISYTAFLTPPLMSLGWLLNVILQGRLGLQSVMSILNQPDGHQKIEFQKLDEIKAQMSKGIFIKDLFFAYPEARHKQVLKKINITIKKGKVIGILGSVGSGKTSIVRCLNKYLDAPRGSIFFGDLDICDIDYQILRKLVRTVSQDAFLFSDTIANNILFGADEGKDLTPKLWRQVFKKSALNEEIKIFSKGKETLIGEKGVMLSGGQKQRISFARSMMKNCEFLILDNIMSALDYETEDILLKQIMNKEQSQTVLIISHRVRVLSQTDEIFVLENGEIVEHGSYESLMQNKSYFYRTWKIQNG